VKSIAGWFSGHFAGWLSRRPWLSALLVFLYVLSPVDLLPEALLGLFGYLDDIALLALLMWVRRRKTPR
jgi:uncharacterized membrane protein YkvA (DUF1232 family)